MFLRRLELLINFCMYNVQRTHGARYRDVTGIYISLVDDHTLHQPCVLSLSFKPRLYSVMDATSLGTLSVAYNRHRPEKSVYSIWPDVTFRYACTHTHNYAYYLIIISFSLIIL